MGACTVVPDTRSRGPLPHLSTGEMSADPMNRAGERRSSHSHEGDRATSLPRGNVNAHQNKSNLNYAIFNFSFENIQRIPKLVRPYPAPSKYKSLRCRYRIDKFFVESSRQGLDFDTWETRFKRVPMYPSLTLGTKPQQISGKCRGRKWNERKS